MEYLTPLLNFINEIKNKKGKALFILLKKFYLNRRNKRKIRK